MVFFGNWILRCMVFCGVGVVIVLLWLEVMLLLFYVIMNMVSFGCIIL